jgi:hypothetical protein
LDDGILDLIRVKNRLLNDKVISSDELKSCKRLLFNSLLRILNKYKEELNGARNLIIATILHKLNSYSKIREEIDECIKDMDDLVEYIGLCNP